MILKIVVYNEGVDDKGNKCLNTNTHFIDGIREVIKEDDNKYRLAIPEEGYLDLYEVKEVLCNPEGTKVNYVMDYNSSILSRKIVPNLYNKPEPHNWDTKRFMIFYKEDKIVETIATLSDQHVYLLNDNGQTIERL
jgi:hypothetical protein